MKTTKLKDGRVSARVYLGKLNGKSLYKRVTSDSLKELKKDIEQARYDFRTQQKARSSCSLTLRECFEAYLRNHRNVLSPSTVKGYEVIIRNSFAPLMDVDIFEITERDLQAEVNRMASNLTFKTISSRRSLFISAVSEYRPEVKFWRSKLPPKQKPDIYVPTDEEVEAVLAYAHDQYPEYELPIMLAAFCGLRRGEIGALTFSDIDFSKALVIVSKSVVLASDRSFTQKAPKSYAGFRSVPLPPRVLEVIRSRRKNGLELISVSIDQMTDRFPNILKGSGVHPMRFHDLRHYFASTLVLLNIPDIYAIKLTGHSTTSMLQRVYQHTFAAAESQFTDALRKKFE